VLILFELHFGLFKDAFILFGIYRCDSLLSLFNIEILLLQLQFKHVASPNAVL